MRPSAVSRGTLALTLVLILASCAKRVPLITPQSAQLSTAQALAVLAETLKGTSAAAVELNRSKVLPDDLARSILRYISLVSQATRGGVAINSSTKTATEKQAEINRIMSDLPKLELPPDISKFINSPQGAQLQALISLISSTAQIITGLIGGAK